MSVKVPDDAVSVLAWAFAIPPLLRVTYDCHSLDSPLDSGAGESCERTKRISPAGRPNRPWVRSLVNLNSTVGAPPPAGTVTLVTSILIDVALSTGTPLPPGGPDGPGGPAVPGGPAAPVAPAAPSLPLQPASYPLPFSLLGLRIVIAAITYRDLPESMK